MLDTKFTLIIILTGSVECMQADIISKFNWTVLKANL